MIQAIPRSLSGLVGGIGGSGGLCIGFPQLLQYAAVVPFFDPQYGQYVISGESSNNPIGLPQWTQYSADMTLSFPQCRQRFIGGSRSILIVLLLSFSRSFRISAGLLYRSFGSNAHALRMMRFNSSLPCFGTGSGSPCILRSSASEFWFGLGTAGGSGRNGPLRSFSIQYNTIPSE